MQEKELGETIISNAIILPFAKGENFGSHCSGVYDERGHKMSNYGEDFALQTKETINKAFINANHILKTNSSLLSNGGGGIL